MKRRCTVVTNIQEFILQNLAMQEDANYLDIINYIQLLSAVHLQPNYVGVICVNMSPRMLVEKKAEIVRYSNYA